MIHTLSLAERQERFENARNSVTRDGGIGTLGEKTLHAVLKQYLEPDPEKREVRIGIGKIVADIYNDDGITEIQTRSYEKLKKKLPHLLETADVTVVLPLPHIKWLIWLDKDTGEMTQKRKSPKTGSLKDGLYELAKLRPFLTDKRLKIHIIMMDVEEYRNLDGWSDDGKRGSSRHERIPVNLCDEYLFCKRDDWKVFIPEGIEDEFTLKEYSKLLKTNVRAGAAGLYILRDMGIVSLIGKRKRENLYKICK